MCTKELVKQRIEEATQEYARELERLGVCPVFPTDKEVIYWVDVLELDQEQKAEMYENAYHELVVAAGDIQDV